MNKELIPKENNKKKYLIIIIILIGCLFRIIAIDKLPVGLNCDEASSGYEAYSILNYGIDRSGNFLPVFLESWGSGQNALYSYILIPFIKIFGLNKITTRLPMAIIGCISLIIWYKLLKILTNNKKFIYIGCIFLSICPWHIMKSRWGLESNIFPDMVLWAFYLIVSFLKTKKTYKLYLASLILGLTGYSYGTSYFFLPIFCLILLIYLIKKKQITWFQAICSLFIVGIIALPIMLYVIINTFNLPQINLPFMTIPRLVLNRYEEQTTLFSGNILYNAFINIKNSILLLITQNDELAWNTIENIGIYYLVSVPFLLIGIFFSFKNTKYKYELDNILNIWFISAFLLLFVFVEANVNRINVLIFPLIYYIIKGIYIIFDITSQRMHLVIISIYIVEFLLFSIYYCKIDTNECYTFMDGVENVIEYVDSISDDYDNIYFEYSIKEPYIYVLYYTKYNTVDFVNTVQYYNNFKNFESVIGFGKYHFVSEMDYEAEGNNIFVGKYIDTSEIDQSKYDIKTIDDFTVITKMNN